MLDTILLVFDLIAIFVALQIWRQLRSDFAEFRKNLEEQFSSPPAPAEEEKPEGKPDPMDEGFENLMRFSVMGKTGFEDGDEE